MVLGQRAVEVAQQLGELLGEVVGHRAAAVALQRDGVRASVPARAAEPQVDAVGYIAASSVKTSATLNGL